MSVVRERKWINGEYNVVKHYEDGYILIVLNTHCLRGIEYWRSEMII